MTFDEAVKFLRETYDDPGICEAVDKAIAPTQAPMQPTPGFHELSEVVRLLREQGRYEDEEGEATNKLADLLAALAAPTQAPAPLTDETPADFAAWLLGTHPHSFINEENMAKYLAEYNAECAAHGIGDKP